jgi:hypothetical protein
LRGQFVSSLISGSTPRPASPVTPLPDTRRFSSGVLLVESFSECRLEQLLHQNQSRSAAEVSLLLLNEVRAWPPASTPQQDDITFLVIDVL